MIFRQLFDLQSSTYTYLLADDKTKKAVYIDTVFENHFRDLALLKELNLDLVHILDTHCHADHITGAWLMEKATGAEIGISSAYGAKNVTNPLEDAQKVKFGERYLEVMHTPGHTEGCMTLVLDDKSICFTGDTLLIRGAGRTDFQGGSAKTLFNSIHSKIFSLPEGCMIYPGHDYSGRCQSTVAEEKAHNPRIGGEANLADFVGYMDNLNLPHPKQIDAALPANMKSGEPSDGQYFKVAKWGPVERSYGGILQIAPEWVSDHLKDLQLIDVRTPEEFQYDLGRVPQSENLPLNFLPHHIDRLSKEKPIVFICRSGRRSAQATVIAQKEGVKNVANLPGGMLSWLHLSLPIDRGDLK